MVGLVVLVVAVVWLAFQLLKGPSTAAEYPTAPTLTVYAQYFGATATAAEAAHRTAVAQQQPATQQPVQATRAPVALPAPTAAPAATPQVATTVPGATLQTAAKPVPAAATSAPTLGPTRAPTAASQAEPARTATVAAAGAEAATPTPWPTVVPELAAEVSEAYTHYWQVKADAFLALDPAPLDSVAAGNELTALRKDIEDDRAQGRAIHVKVQSNFIVLSADHDQAQVADRLRDLSVYVDPSTQQPLPGEAEPASPDAAPEIHAIYQLRRIDGVWKVVDGGSVQ
jgi:hypothetical protein